MFSLSRLFPLLALLALILPALLLACETEPAAKIDREALVAFYNATDGPNWAINKNWLSEAPLAEWWGVRTNASGYVTSLDLHQTLSGKIPPELGNLANLEYLDLSGTR